MNIENSQVVDGPLDISMEAEGSEDQVLSTRSSPPPLGEGIETLGIFLRGAWYWWIPAPGLREMRVDAGHFPPLIGGSRQDILSPLLRVCMPPIGGGGAYILTLM